MRPVPTLPDPNVALNGPVPWWLMSFYVLGLAVVVVAVATLIFSG